jgi:DNA-binding transcriptional LysR family regulator
MLGRMEWDDLRYVLAINRAGGLNAAARTLGVNPSSVFRRLGALEKRQEVRLFERLRSGYRLTPAGEAFAEAAERMEEEVLKVQRHVKGADTRLEGHIRVSLPEEAAQYLVPRWLAEFRQTYPGLSLEISTGSQFVNLSKREIDVVIRGTSAPPEHLVGRRASRLGMAAYASKRYLDRVGRGRPLADYAWLGLSGALGQTPMAQWVGENVPESSIQARVDLIAAARAMLGADMGCTAMACFVCDGDPALERIPGTHQVLKTDIWVLTHPDLRRSARIRAFLQFFATRLAAIEPELMGLA